MVNKKAYIRTIEAIIAIVLILTFTVYVWPKDSQVESKIPRDIELTLDRTINEFQYNEEYRGCILQISIVQSLTSGDIQNLPDVDTTKVCYNKISDFIKSSIPQTLLYSFSICSVTQACIPSDLEISLPKENIYTKGVFITTDTTTPTSDSKTVKLYIWRKA